MPRPKRINPEPVSGLDYGRKIDMDMKELLLRLPKFKESDIKYFISRGVISKFPIRILDFEVLKRLHIVWNTPSLFKVVAQATRKDQRAKVLEEVNMGASTQLESWIYTRIINAKRKGQKIPRQKIIKEAISLFKLKNSDKERQKIMKIIKRFSRKIQRIQKQHKVRQKG